jgi:nucleotide-binding universal stress UspA family protein
MSPAIKPGWSKPATILFATEFPANENAFSFALAQAIESAANLVVFHVYEGAGATNYATSASHPNHYPAARAKRQLFDSLAERAGKLGIQCRVVVRPGIPSDEILRFLREHVVDRVVMGARTPGPVGRLLVGSVAETVLRRANVPVHMIGPYVIEGTYRNFVTGTIVCSVSAHPSAYLVARFAAELAASHKAHLVLLQVISPQERTEVLAGRTIGQMEAELLDLIPAGLKASIDSRADVVVGDPTEELLYLGRVLQANLIVLGAQTASHFAAMTCTGIVYKVLAYARCPVVTLSPVLLAEPHLEVGASRLAEVKYLAGVF